MITAFIDGGAVATASNGLLGSLSVTATDASSIFAVSVGAAGAGGVSVTGAVGVNDISNTVDAHLSGGAVVTANSTLTVAATDTSTDASITLQGGGATVGIGGGASYSEIDNHILAYLDGATVKSKAGSVVVNATSNATVESLTAGANGGFVGIAGNVAVTYVETKTEAYIARSNVDAYANVVVFAESNDVLTVAAGAGAGGFVGVAGTVVVSTVQNVTRAYLENATVAAHGHGAASTIKRWDPDTGAQTTQSIHGLAVVANSIERPASGLPTLVAINGAGGFVGVGALVSATTVNDQTDAYISGSVVNSDADYGGVVIVRAHSDETLNIISGGTAGGAVGVGATIDRTKITSRTRAFISNTDESGSDPTPATSVIHAKGVEVGTVTREKIDLVVVGIVGGAVAVAGTVSVVDIDADTEAFVRDSDVFSVGDLSVTADDTATLNPDVGTASGGAIGVGGTVGDITIENTVRAQVLGGHLNATGAMTVGADSDETIDTLIGTAGLGAAGLAGSVAITNIETTTEALVQSGSRPSLINQDPRFKAGGAFAPGLGQSVTVKADDTASIDGDTGTLAAGAVGFGASVDVGAIRNRTVAAVGAQSSIAAVGDVAVLSHANHAIDSLVLAFAGGLAGLAGAVSVQSIGGATDGTANTEFNKSGGGGSLRDQTNNSLNTPDVSGAIDYSTNGSNPLATRAANDVNALGDPTVDSSVGAIGGSDRVTSAFIDDASAGNGASIVAGRDILIDSTNLYHLNQATGSGALGAVGVGAGISVGSVHTTTESYVGNHDSLRAGQDITVHAQDRERDSSSKVETIGGSAGLIALDANVGTLNVQSDTTARLKNDSTIVGAQNVSILADQQSHAESDGKGFGLGLAAAGAVVTTANVDASVTADVGSGVKIGGGGGTVGNLNVKTTADNSADASALVAKAGLLAGNYGTGTSTVHADHNAHIGDAVIVVTGAVNVSADSTGSADADTSELAVGLASGGASTPTARVEGTVGSGISDGANIQAGSIAVNSNATSTSTANGEAIGGGVVAGNASVVNAEIAVDVVSHVDLATLNASGQIGVAASSTATATADSGQVAIGAVAGGASVSTADIAGSTRAYLAGGANLSANTVNVQSQFNGNAQTESEATGGGLVSGNAATANSQSNGVSEAYIGGGATVGTLKDTTVNALSTRTAQASTGQLAIGLVGGGGSVATARSGGLTLAHIDGAVTSGGNTSVEANDSSSLADAAAVAGSGGVVSGTAADAEATYNPEIRSYIGAGSDIKTSSNVLVRSKSLDAKANADASGTVIAALSAGDSHANSFVSPTVEASIRGGKVDADQNITIASENTPNVSNATASSSGGSAIGVILADGTARGEADVSSYIGAADVHAVQAILVQTNSTNNARASGSGTAIGLLAGLGDVSAHAFAGHQTQAYLGNGSKVASGTLTVQAVGTDYGLTSTEGSGGGLISANATLSNSDIGGHVLASINDGATANIDTVARVSATDSPEGDAVSKANAYGAVASGESHSNAVIHPTVEGRVGGNAHVTTGGDTIIESNSGAYTSPSTDTFSPTSDVDLANDTITIPGNGLADGSQIVYSNEGNSSVGGLENGRQYSVITVNPDTFKLGVRFDGAAVDGALDTIKTAGPHNFHSGDRVVYESDGQPPLPGLVDGGTYFVRVIDSTTIKLTNTQAEATDTPFVFDASDVDSADNTIFALFAGGLAANQPVTYHAPAPAVFFSGYVDVAESSGTLATNANGTIADFPASNNIFLPNHHFSTGDAVVYRVSDPTKAIGGLIPNAVYYVIKVDNDSIQLASSPANANSSTPIDLTPDKLGPGRTATHTLARTTDVPIAGLVDGRTYYVTIVDALHIGLSATPGGPLIDIDATGRTGSNSIGFEGIDIGSSTGTQALRLDLTSQPGGVHRILGPGGVPLSLVNPPKGDGRSSVSASGSGGGAFFGSQGGVATVLASPVVRAFVDSGGSGQAITAGGNIIINSSSIANVSSNATNSSGGFVGSGSTLSQANVYNTNDAYVGDGSGIIASNGITITAHATQITDSYARSSGGGVIDLAESDSDSDIDYLNRARSGSNARLTAAGTIHMEAFSDTQANNKASSDASGLGADSDANDDDRGETSPGAIRIGLNQGALSQVEVGAGSTLMADRIDLTGRVDSSQGTSIGRADASALGADTDALARVVLNDHANVAIRGGAKVTGKESVNILTLVQGLVTNADAVGDFSGVGGDTDATAISHVTTLSDVTAEAGALVTTHFLDVMALQGSAMTRVHADSDGGAFDDGDPYPKETFDPRREIDWNSNVFLTAGPSPTLVIDANGQVVQATNISYSITPTSIVVNDILFTDPGTAHFTTDEFPGAASVGVITGNQSTFGFQENFDAVTITNSSSKDLVINRIDPVNRTTIPEVTIDVTSVPFEFNVGQKFTPTLITITNNNTASQPDILLNGVIDNPIGTTKLVNATGDIASTSSGASAAVVRTNTFDALATLGSIASGRGGLNVELVESAGRPTHLFATAGTDVRLNITGRQRTIGASSFTVNIDSIRAGNQATVVMREAQRETTLPANWYAVEVTEPLVPRLTEVISHFRPGAGDPPPDVETGVFGLGAVSVDSTYNFGLLEGANINVSRSGTATDLRLTANTNILSTGSIFASTNGNVNLTETVGDLRAGFIVSSAGDVSLTSPASIVDAFNDSVADVAGSNITLKASGSIGSTGNPLDINSAEPSFGVLNAGAVGDIVVNETSGALYVAGAGTFGGSIQLTTYDSSSSGEDLYVLQNASVRTFSGSITLRAGDSVVTEPGSLVSTDLEFGGDIGIYADFNDADPGTGASVYIDGTLRASRMQIQGNFDNDFVDLDDATVVGSLQVFGGSGDDTLFGGPDAVWFHGQNGRDYIIGGSGADTIDGGPGSDTLLGGPGNDVIAGGPDDDFLYGNDGIDTLVGGPGNDFGVALNGGNDYDHKFEFGGTNDCELPEQPIIIKLSAVPSPLPRATPGRLTSQALAPILQDAIRRWDAIAGVDPVGAALQGLTVQIADLPGPTLGETIGSTIVIDVNAGGYGWFVDSTPADDSEFPSPTGSSESIAGANTPAARSMDLLTVVLHELGHVLGLPHADAGSHDLMADSLGVGVRRVPVAADLPPIALSVPMPDASAPVNLPSLTADPRDFGLPDDLNDSWRLPEEDLLTDVAQSSKQLEDELLVEVAQSWKKHGLPLR